MFHISLSVFCFDSCFSNFTIMAANNVIMRPWPTSPNITAKRNGNVTIVYKAEIKSNFNDSEILYKVMV